MFFLLLFERFSLLVSMSNFRVQFQRITHIYAFPSNQELSILVMILLGNQAMHMVWEIYYINIITHCLWYSRYRWRCILLLIMLTQQHSEWRIIGNFSWIRCFYIVCQKVGEWNGTTSSTIARNVCQNLTIPGSSRCS